MDQNREQEQGQLDLVHFTNTSKDDLNPFLAEYEVLKQLGFSINFEEGATDIYGKPLEDHLRVMVSQSERSKIEQIDDMLSKLPEFGVFRDAADGQPVGLERLLDGKLDSLMIMRNITIEWSDQNKQLVERALKAAYLKSAERGDFLGFEKAAQEDRAKAEGIEEPPLDPEGIRIILYQKARSLLDAHPELRPKEYKERSENQPR